MTRRLSALIGAVTLLVGLLGVAPAAAQPRSGSSLEVYVAELTMADLQMLGSLGIDRREISTSRRASGALGVELILSDTEAAKLRASGIDLAVKHAAGSAASDRMRAQAHEGFEVFRPYSGPGGLQEELLETAAAHPDLVEVVTIGQSVQGQDILALRVTKDPGTVEHGGRPATLYVSAQHAREWITPEMTRRLLHYYLDNYGSDQTITDLVDTTELWFVVVANPDGYDYTFTGEEGENRLWRKNLRDNNGDGEITGIDGVDLNRNFPTRWGYDNEGSSPSWSSETYRGSAPASEPETQALDGLMARIDFSFLINYHSAAELLLYGTGWQVATRTPNDLIYEAMAGTSEANSAVPGYDPDLSAELYTTNGDTDTHAENAHGILGFTPEMSTCETISAQDPDDEWLPEDCQSGFNFPDDEELVQAEFEKNIPFAVAVAQSAPDPANPVTATGLDVPDFEVDAFDISYGDGPQTVAAFARRSLENLRLEYSVNGGPVRTAPVAEWDGGERYGDENNRYFAEFRGEVPGTQRGDRVEVWFAADGPDSGSVASEHFTYRVLGTTSADVLIVADEDLNGVNPEYPEDVQSPKYVGRYRQALLDDGVDSVKWNVDRDGVPHDLGVLGHFDAVVWYLGDNRLTQDPEDEFTDVFFDEPLPDAAVAERAQYLTLAMRDYLNQGGKLLHAGETAGYFGILGSALGGIYYGLDGAPEEDCVVTVDPFADCLLLSDDFYQYYLGAYGRSATPEPRGVEGVDDPFAGDTYLFGDADVPAIADNPLNEAGSFSVTSQALPPSEFPQFESWGSSRYLLDERGPTDPLEGEWYVATLHADDSYMRLTRTIDLTDVAAGADPRLEFGLSFDTEPGYDNVIVEAHPVGTDDWTTLPEVSGLTDSDVPTECEVGFLLEQHPFLEHYLTLGDTCAPTGTTGEWHRFTGNSQGWQQVAFDLSAYTGTEVEVSISYVTDPASGGLGVFIDDARVTSGGDVVDAEGFEEGLGSWTVSGSPEGSAPNIGSFSRSQVAFASSVTTPDSVLLGFGVEQLTLDRPDAPRLMADAMRHLLGEDVR